MSIFGFYFVSGLLQEAGWPRAKGFWPFKRQVVDALILDSAIDQMVDWAAAIGAERPTLALQMLSEMFRERDWEGDNRPNIKAFIERAKQEMENWRVTEAIAPHDAIQRTRFAGDDAHRRAAEGIKSAGPEWRGPMAPAKILRDSRVLLEHFTLEGLLWGLANQTAFGAWFNARHADQTQRLGAMRESGLAIGSLPDLAQYLADSERILRNYENDIGPLPGIPDQLLADARSLGRQV